MNGFWLLIAAFMAFLTTCLLGKKLIPFLHKIKYGQPILEDDGPSWHKSKQGTPTMGGITFIIGVILSSVACILAYFFSVNVAQKDLVIMQVKIFAGLGMALCYGILGFLDDYIKVIKKRNLGLKAKQKLFFQFLIAAMYLTSIYIVKKCYGKIDITFIEIPFLGTYDFGIFYWIIAAIMIAGIVNAVNLTDGIDGLNGSVTFFNGIFLTIIAIILNMPEFSIISVCLSGGCLGFLVWNFYPAKIFMGDTGALFLGGMICAIVFGFDKPLLLVPIGLVYLLEMFSVMLQVIYFKITKGKRILKMSPIHHHFEMCGWKESKICLIFSTVAIFGGIIALLYVKFLA